MTRNEFIELIDTSGDIMFECSGKSYTILCWNEDGPLVSEQDTESNECVFRDGEALVSQYIIDGKPLQERIDELSVTFAN